MLNPAASLVVYQDGKFITFSWTVAAQFGKRHTNVSRIIDVTLSSPNKEIAQFGALNFEHTTYRDPHNRVRRGYSMTLEGLMELTMGFTGDVAQLIRIRFIAAFKALEAKVKALLERRADELEKLHARDNETFKLASAGSGWMHQRRAFKKIKPIELGLLTAPIQMAFGFEGGAL